MSSVAALARPVDTAAELSVIQQRMAEVRAELVAIECDLPPANDIAVDDYAVCTCGHEKFYHDATHCSCTERCRCQGFVLRAAPEPVFKLDLGYGPDDDIAHDRLLDDMDRHAR